MIIAPFTRPLSLARRLVAAIITGFGVAALVHGVNLLVFFATNGAAAANTVAISDFFAPTSLVLFFLLVIAVALGAMRIWYVALAVGLVAGLTAAFGGTVLAIVSGGTAFDATVAAAAASTLVSNNLILIVLATVATATVGRRIWAAVNRVTAGTPRPLALVRQPSARLTEGQVTHIERVAIDAELADAQWDAYVEALVSAGFEAVDVSASDEHPDSVFVEDALVVFGGTAVVTSPGAESRRGETAAVSLVARNLGLDIRTIELPGTLDGGDVLIVGTTVYVGRGGRTNAEGISQLRAIITPLGYTLVTVPVKKVLHLKSAVTALPDGTIIGYAKLVDSIELFDRFLAMPEPSGAAVVVVSHDTVLMAASAPKSKAIIEDLGYRVITVDISEFEKLEGCVTCLSVRIS